MPKLYIKRGHGIVPNQLLNDENVSLKAKGMYAYIQSKPDGWQFSADRIALAHKESMYTIKTTLRELEKLKYLIRKKYQNEHGRWDWEYTLLASPSVEYPPTVEPPSVIPSADTPPSVSPPILVNKNYKKRNSKKELDIVSNDTISETSSLEGDVVSDFIPHQDEIIQAPPLPPPHGGTVRLIVVLRLLLHSTMERWMVQKANNASSPITSSKSSNPFPRLLVENIPDMTHWIRYCVL